ncbi:MAG TPA: hypothetical protein VFJ06_01275 [Halococcus sp.]|nr:hypothetical protein [Halococcus sp.]
MSHDFRCTQSRSPVSLAVVTVVVLVALVSAVSFGIGIGVSAAQAAPNGNGSTPTNTMPANTTGSEGAPPASASGNGMSQLDRLRRTSAPGQGSPSRNASTNTSGTGSATSNSPGVVEPDETWSEYIGANGTNGSASGQNGGRGGGGILGTAGNILGGVYDTGAGFFDWLAGGTDEYVGGFFKGARAFFSWMLGFFIKQAASIVNETIDKAVEAMSMTPHPNRVNNFYHNPTNPPWGIVYDTWRETGQPLTRLLWLSSLGFLMAFGNQFGVGVISYAREKQGWFGLALTAFFITDAGWTLTNIVPHVVDVFTQSFVNDITTTSLMESAAKGLVVLFVLVLVYFEFFFVVFLLFVAAIRIGVIIAFAPFIPALVVAWFSPFKMLSAIAKAAVHLWLVLLVSAMPSSLFLNAAFNMAQAAASGNAGPLGTIMVIPLIVGGLLAAALMPFLLWKASSKLMGMIGSGTPGSQSSPQWREKMSEYRRKAARPNRFQRGFRRKDPVEDDGGTGAHRAGRATRDAPRNAKGAANSATTKARTASSTAKTRAANMKDRLSNITS